MQQQTSVREARQFILSRVVAAAGEERVAVRDCLGRVLAADVAAPFDVPGFDNSAMDGFAARVCDLHSDKETALLVVGDSFAGRSFDGEVKAGRCVRIMTGAKIPPGCDIVIPQEETRTENDKAIIFAAARKRGAHLRLAGEDLRADDCALPGGALCNAAAVGLLASLGLGEVSVRRRLRVAFFSTGDELRSLGEPLATGEIYDSNRYTLHAMIRKMGLQTIDLGVVRDDKKSLAAVVDSAARQADAIISSGGASVGAADYIREVLNARGESLFWKVAMRPGRPLIYGKVGRGESAADFFGLPGNPVSVMVCFYQFVQQALWKRGGRLINDDAPTLPAVAATNLRKAKGRMEFQRGFVFCEDKQWRVRATGDQGSGILSSMTDANCFIVLEEARGNVAAGETVQVQLFEGLM